MKRWLLWTGISFLVLITALVLLSGWLSSLALERLKQEVHKASGGVYTIAWEDASIEPLALRVRIKGMTLKADTAAAWKSGLNFYAETSVPELWLRATDITQIWDGAQLSMRRIWLNKAKLTVVLNDTFIKENQQKETPALELQQLDIDQLELNILRRNLKDTLLQTEKLDFHLQQINVDQDRGFWVENGQARLLGNKLQLNRNPFSLDSLEFLVKKNRVELHTHSFRPDELILALSKGENALFRENTLQMELRDLEIHSGEIWSLLQVLQQFPMGTSRLESVILHEPKLSVLFPQKVKNEVKKGAASDEGTMDIFRELDHNPIELGNFEIRNSNLAWGASGKLKDWSLKVKEFRLLPGYNFVPIAFDSLFTSFKQLEWVFEGKTYQLQGNDFELQADRKLASVKWAGIRADPLPALIAAAGRDMFLHNVFRVKVQELALKHIDVQTYLREGILNAALLEMHTPELQIEKNKNKPFPPKEKPLLQTILKMVPFPFAVAKVNFHHGLIRNREIPNGRTEWATITLDQVLLTGTGVSNRKGKDQMELDFKARIAGSGILQVHFSGQVTDPMARHYLKGTLSNLKLSDLNSFIGPTFMVGLEGTLNQAFFEMRANYMHETGSLMLNYNGLVLNSLDGDGAVPGALKQFISGRLFKTDFVSRKPEPINWTRDRQRGFVNFWIRGLLEAAKNTLGGQTMLGKMLTGKDERIKVIKELDKEKKPLKAAINKLDSLRQERKADTTRK